MSEPRDVVLCLDGTNNEIAEPATNVLRLYRALRHDPERVAAFYDPGVGTFAVRPSLTSVARDAQRVAGLAFGYGFRENVAEAYEFLVRHHRPGDRIWIFGFSRGAYAARVVAALVKAYGVAREGSEHLIPYMLTYLEMPIDYERIGRLRKMVGGLHGVPVHFVGLWDTVSSVSWLFDPLAYGYTTSNDAVATVRHAVALDERRAFFRTNLWTPSDGQDVKEVWFPGVHSDVGGGYDDGSLSKLALEWIMVEARAAGLPFDDAAAREALAGDAPQRRPSPLGLTHRSLKGAWWIAEVWPKRPWSTREQRRRIRLNLGRRRHVPDDAVLHASVAERIDAGLAEAPPGVDLASHAVEPCVPFDPSIDRSRPPADPAVQPATWAHRAQTALVVYLLVGLGLAATGSALPAAWSLVSVLTIATLWPLTFAAPVSVVFVGVVWPLAVLLVGRLVDWPLAEQRSRVEGRWLHARPWYSPATLRSQFEALGGALPNYRRALVADLPFIAAYTAFYLWLWDSNGRDSDLAADWPLVALWAGAAADVVEDVTLLAAIAVTRAGRAVSDLHARLAAVATAAKFALLGAAAAGLFVIIVFG